MHGTLRIAMVLVLLVTATSAFAQQSQQNQNDQTAKEVHDNVKDGLNSIGTAEEQGPSPTTSSSMPDTNSIHDQAHTAVQKGAEVFDGTTSAISEAIR